MQFFKQVLKNNAHPFKLVAVHHPFAGDAGDEPNTNYGRGGGKAAKLGDQRLLHEVMVKNGVQALLHAHDHLFNDEVVDGVHYTCTGTASAPWAFPREGAYSSSRLGHRGRYGTVRLVVPAGGRKLDVRFVDGNDTDVGGYSISPRSAPTSS